MSAWEATWGQDQKNVKKVLIVFRAEQRASIFITVVHVYH